MTARSLRVLLDGLIDYAGLFPPAALPMDDAIRNYARYFESDEAWALGRFVVPLDQVGLVPEVFPISILGDPGSEAARAEVERAGRVRRLEADGHGGAPGERALPVFEVKATSAGEVERIAASADGLTVYVEITDLSLLEPIARHGLRAKIRTGGVTADAFPAVERVAEFIRACRSASVPFKATAGLHHPMRCVKPLTYEQNAPAGTMHGFLNVFLAALFADDEEEVLRETSASAFVFADEGVAWRGRRASLDEIRAMRAFANSFGSCSFEEPVGELAAFGWL